MSFQNEFDRFSRELQSRGEISSITAEFTKCHTDEERVKLVLNLPSFKDIFAVEKPKNWKSLTKSLEYKEAGNRYYKCKNFTKALELYTLGIFTAPKMEEFDSESKENVLPLLYANRSAVLLYLKKFSLCSRDIDLAVASGYPKRSVYKLYQRKGKCFSLSGNNEMAKHCFSLSLASLAEVSLTLDERNNVARDLIQQEQQCDKCLRTDTPKVNLQQVVSEGLSQQLKPSIKPGDRHLVFSSASKSFALSYDPDKGRKAVATEDIYPGDVIIVDQPFSKIVLPEFYNTHCFHCMSRCDALIPCRNCAVVGFCSLNCEEESWKQYHFGECLFLNHVIDSGIDFAHLALRVILNAGCKYLLSLKTKDSLRNDELYKPHLNSTGIHDPLDYLAIHFLVTNTEKRTVADLFLRSVKAAFLVNYLKLTPFFPSDVTGSDVHFIGGLILRQLQILPCNAHEISEIEFNPETFAASELKEIGSAIYATLSLLNHSCDPVVVRHSYKGNCVLRAIKKIKKGQEIVDNYGALYAVTKVNERRRLLESQYYFYCNCNACVNMWPSYTEIYAGEPIFKCPNCESMASVNVEKDMLFLNCMDCGYHQDYRREVEKFHKSRIAFQAAKKLAFECNRFDIHLQLFLDHLAMIVELVYLPWQEFNDCQEIVKQCFSFAANHHYNLL